MCFVYDTNAQQTLLTVAINAACVKQHHHMINLECIVRNGKCLYVTRSISGMGESVKPRAHYQVYSVSYA